MDTKLALQLSAKGYEPTKVQLAAQSQLVKPPPAMTDESNISVREHAPVWLT